MFEKCVLTILELNWNQCLGQKKTKLNICHHMLTQLQNRSFHVVERTRTSSKCQKMKYARAKRAKILFFLVKYANLWDFCCRRRCNCLKSLSPLFFSILDEKLSHPWIQFKKKLNSSRPSMGFDRKKIKISVLTEQIEDWYL